MNRFDSPPGDAGRPRAAADPAARGVDPGRLRRMLNRRFLVAIAAAAGLLAANQLLVRPSLLALTGDAPTINVAGRQRMLSQRLAKAALGLRAAADDAERTRRRDELRRTLELWSHSHRGLQQGDAALLLSGANSPAVRTAFAGLEPSFVAMQGAAARLIDGSDEDGPLRTILEHEQDYLTRMDRIVGLYELEARRHVRTLERAGWALSAAVLAALAGVGAFVLLPAGATIGRQFDALRRAGDRLEGRVRERTEELEQANVALAQEHRERLAAEEQQRRLVEEFGRVARVHTMGEMASGLAHELNQPLGAVANYVEGCLLRIENGDARPDLLAEPLRKALKAALRAGEIVQRVRLSVSRGVEPNDRLDAPRLLREVAEFVEEDARRRGVRVSVAAAPDLPCVRGDAVQLRQALLNLVTNAFDAIDAAQPQRPHVVLRATVSRPGRLEFAVEDNGDGIAEDDRGRLFDAFHSKRAHGMGMGLAIVRSIVEAHHGEVAVESEIGRGSRFRLTIPTADDAEPAPAAGPPDAAPT